MLGLFRVLDGPAKHTEQPASVSFAVLLVDGGVLRRYARCRSGRDPEVCVCMCIHMYLVVAVAAVVDVDVIVVVVAVVAC